jgi:Ras-related protein Rab-11A
MLTNSIKEIKESSESEDYFFKIVVVGDAAVGKSNILTRYVQDDFTKDSKSTVGVELSTKLYKIDDKYVKVHLWDTAGQERYSSITAAYYKGAKGALIVYDITRRETFMSVDKWYKEIISLADKNLITMMIGNKSDLSLLRQVTFEEAVKKADHFSKIV